MTKTMLRPGMDLDILVELHVLKTPKEAIDKYLRWLNDPARLTYNAAPPEEGYHHPRSLSKFIDVAINYVVAAMRKDGFTFKCWQPCVSLALEAHLNRPVDSAFVSFICGAGPCTKHKTDFHNHHGAYEVEGETLAHAICLAALQALGHIKPEPSYVPGPCKPCGGSGEIGLSDGEIACPECGGSGDPEKPGIFKQKG